MNDHDTPRITGIVWRPSGRHDLAHEMKLAATRFRQRDGRWATTAVIAKTAPEALETAVLAAGLRPLRSRAGQPGEIMVGVEGG